MVNITEPIYLILLPLFTISNISTISFLKKVRLGSQIHAIEIIDPNYSALGFSYLKTKNGMKINGRNVQGVLGDKRDDIQKTCNVLFKIENESEYEEVPVLLKDGTSIIKNSPYKVDNCQPLANKISNVMGLTNNDVIVKSHIYYTGSENNETTYFYENVVVVPIASNPLSYSSPYSSVLNELSLQDGYSYQGLSTFQLHQPLLANPPNTGSASGAFIVQQLHETYPHTFNLG